MDTEVQSRLDRSMRFEPCASAILGLCFFQRASELIDQREHGDLVFKVDSLIVGVRVQRRRYHEDYGDHATFRVRTQNGMETEWAKICAGNGPSHFLSGFEDARKPNSRIGRWLLLEVGPLSEETRVYGPFQNRDGSSLVRVQREDFPSGSLVRSGNFLRVDTGSE